MKKYMIGLGIASFLVAVIGGLMSGGFNGFLIGILSGTISSGIFFGIVALLDGQDFILSEFHILNNRARNAENTSVICKKCNKEYDNEYTSCPYCGNKQ